MTGIIDSRERFYTGLYLSRVIVPTPTLEGFKTLISRCAENPHNYIWASGKKLPDLHSLDRLWRKRNSDTHVHFWGMRRRGRAETPSTKLCSTSAQFTERVRKKGLNFEILTLDQALKYLPPNLKNDGNN